MVNHVSLVCNHRASCVRLVLLHPDAEHSSSLLLHRYAAAPSTLPTCHAQLVCGKAATQTYTSVRNLLANPLFGAQTEMKKKVDKWQEPAPAKQHKVLPVPDMEPKKRRGGRRFRKMKERYGLTDMRKAANRSAYLQISS